MDHAFEPPRTILVVEDEPDVLLIMRSLLRELTSGYEITTVGSGFDALALVQKGGIALVLTDYNMPGLNGLELLRRIKSVSPATKVIMVTAFAGADLERKARAAGASAFLPKPFGLDELIGAMQRALSN
ncbi:MAG: response regulator [Oscillochloris sp.]|nr:response regulator [Oscillochloris sp.]